MRGFQEKPQDKPRVTGAMGGLAKGSGWQHLLWECRLASTSWSGRSGSARAAGLRGEPGDTGASPCK